MYPLIEIKTKIMTNKRSIVGDWKFLISKSHAAWKQFQINNSDKCGSIENSISIICSKHYDKDVIRAVLPQRVFGLQLNLNQCSFCYFIDETKGKLYSYNYDYMTSLHAY